MRYLFASLVLLLLVSVGASLPAAAESRSPVRERSAERWSEGLRFNSPRLNRQRQARSGYGESRAAVSGCRMEFRIIGWPASLDRTLCAAPDLICRLAGSGLAVHFEFWQRRWTTTQGIPAHCHARRVHDEQGRDRKARPRRQAKECCLR